MKTGRPKSTETRETLRHIGFKADKATCEALAKLVAHARQPGVVSLKSVAIRRAIIEAAERLPEGGSRRETAKKR